MAKPTWEYTYSFLLYITYIIHLLSYMTLISPLAGLIFCLPQ